MDRERHARTQTLLRDVNERIADIAAGWGESSQLDVLCECSVAHCLGLIHVPFPLYRSARAGSRRFIVLNEHVGDDRVLEEHLHFAVVELDGAAGEIADEAWAGAPAGAASS